MLFSVQAMHLPDGFLSPIVAVIGWALAIMMLAIAGRKTRGALGERRIPLMGILGAFIFAAQAINFPVAAGTSGHLLGGALAAILMGPWAASLMMAAVIVLQGLVFQDGGLLVMGWNILNMGVITAFTGIAVYRLARRFVRDGKTGRIAAAFVAAWLSVELAALATSIELAASGTFPLNLAVPAMVGVHALIGLGEAVITVGVILFLQNVRPDVLEAGEQAPGGRSAGWIAAGLGLALVVAMLSPLASSSPDGLNWVAEQGGFHSLEAGPAYHLLPGYQVPLIASPALATIAGVMVGTVLVFGVGLIIGRWAVRRSGAGGGD